MWPEVPFHLKTWFLQILMHVSWPLKLMDWGSGPEAEQIGPKQRRRWELWGLVWKTKSLHVSGLLRRFNSKQYFKNANEKCIPFSCYAIIFGQVFIACLFDLYSKGKQCRSVLGRLIFVHIFIWEYSKIS